MANILLNLEIQKQLLLRQIFLKFVEILQKNVHDICHIECPNDKLCNNHRKLSVLKYTENWYRNKNINSDIFISKVNIRICDHPYCFKNWCFSIYETTYLGYDCCMRYRSNFL